jgi:hypothetical protein
MLQKAIFDKSVKNSALDFPGPTQFFRLFGNTVRRSLTPASVWYCNYNIRGLGKKSIIGVDCMMY